MRPSSEEYALDIDIQPECDGTCGGMLVEGTSSRENCMR